MSSPDGQVSEMAKNGGVGGGGVGSVRHLLDLHKGYRAPPRAHAWQDRLADGRDGCARGGARSGLRQVEEMPNRPVVVEELPVSEGVAHQVAGPPVSDYLSDDPPGNRCTSPDCTGRNPERSAR